MAALSESEYLASELCHNPHGFEMQQVLPYKCPKPPPDEKEWYCSVLFCMVHKESGVTLGGHVTMFSRTTYGLGWQVQRFEKKKRELQEHLENTNSPRPGSIAFPARASSITAAS